MSGVETPGVFSEHDDLDEDIERLNIVLHGEAGEEEIESDTELQSLDRGDNETFSRASLPSTSRPSTSRHSTSRHSTSRPSTSSDVTASSFPTTSMCTETDELVLRFDPTSISAESSLAMNRAYQEVLLDTLRQIEMALHENRARQKQLADDLEDKNVRGAKPSAPKVKSLTDYTAPYFRDADGNGPPCNEDVALKSNLNEAKQFVKPKSGWSKIQRKVLLNAVKVDALEQQIRPLMNKLEVETNKLAKCRTQEEIDESKERIASVKDRIADKQKMDSKELLASVNVNRIDFMKISAIEFDGKYTHTECESMWRNVLRPEINRDRWSAEEDERLVELAQQHGNKNWTTIAAQLGTRRTPFQCLQHFQQKNYIYDQSEWTPEEDELLKEVIETCQFGKGNIQWQQVTYYMERRSSTQCKVRWFKICPYIKRGWWTDQEDAALKNAIQMIGDSDWIRVQEFVPFRNAAQCRERWNNTLDPSLKMGKWTYDEDKKLLNLIAEYGKVWANIATQLPGRTDNMCLCRYKLLMRWQRNCDEFNKEPLEVKKDLISPCFEIRENEFIFKEKVWLQLQKKREKEQRKRLMSGKRKIKKEKTGKKHDGDEDYVVSEEEDEQLVETGDVAFDKFAREADINAGDYLRQMEDARNGELVVPRPPPMKKFANRNYQSTWSRRRQLQGLVQSCVKMSTEKEGGADDTTTTEDISTSLGPIMNIDKSDKEKWDLISQGLKGRMPHELTVRQLLDISRAIKETGTIPPHILKGKDFDEYDSDDMDRFNDDDEEEEEVEEEANGDQQDCEEDDSDLEDAPMYQRVRSRVGPRTQKAMEGDRIRLESRQRHYEVNNHIKNIIRRKRSLADLGDPDSEWRKWRGVKRRYQLFPERDTSSSRDQTKVANKSLAILLKSFDIDTKAVYNNASRLRRRHSALALLNTTNSRRSQRQQIARNQTYLQLKSQETDTADLVLGLRQELGIDVSETDDNNAAEMEVDMKGITDGQLRVLKRKQSGLNAPTLPAKVSKKQKGRPGRPRKKEKGHPVYIKQEVVEMSEQVVGVQASVIDETVEPIRVNHTGGHAGVSESVQKIVMDATGDNISVQSGLSPVQKQQGVSSDVDPAKSGNTLTSETNTTGAMVSSPESSTGGSTAVDATRRTGVDATTGPPNTQAISTDTTTVTPVRSGSIAVARSNSSSSNETTTPVRSGSMGIARPSSSLSTPNPDRVSRPPTGSVGYNRMLPYIPPNLANLSGMKTLLMDHQGLIQKAGTFFDKEEFKDGLYKIKDQGANPLLPVFICASKMKGRQPSKTLKVEGDNEEGVEVAVMRHPKHVLVEKIRQTREYQLLKARFQSLFVWPSLISTMKLSKSLLTVPEEELEALASTSAAGAQEQTNNGDKEMGDEELDSLQAEDDDQVLADAGVEDNVARAVEEVMESEGEDLSHEQAIEKLVEKIREEYRIAREGKKKSNKKSRKHLSEAVWEGVRQRERTKILKRLGLFDVMEGYRLQREQQQQQSQSPLPTETSHTGTDTIATSTNSSQAQTSMAVAHTSTSVPPTFLVTKSGLVDQSATSTTETGASGFSGVQPRTRLQETPMDDESEVVINVKMEAVEADEEVQGAGLQVSRSQGTGTEELFEEVPVKKKRGRPKGKKNFANEDHGETRKSSRQIETPTVLVDSVITPLKKTQKQRVFKLTKLKQMVPGKISNLKTMLPEVPLVKQAEQEAVEKAEAKAKKEAEKDAKNQAKQGKKRGRKASESRVYIEKGEKIIETKRVKEMGGKAEESSVDIEKGKKIIEEWKRKKIDEEKKKKIDKEMRRHQAFWQPENLQLRLLHNVPSGQQEADGGRTVVVKMEAEDSTSEGIMYDADGNVVSGGQNWVNPATGGAVNNSQNWADQITDGVANDEQSSAAAGAGTSLLETRYVVHSGQDFYVERHVEEEEEEGEEEGEEMEGNYTAELLDMNSGGTLQLPHSHSHSNPCDTDESVDSSNIKVVSTSQIAITSNTDNISNTATNGNMATASGSHVAIESRVAIENTGTIDSVTSAKKDPSNTASTLLASSTETCNSEVSKIDVSERLAALIKSRTSKPSSLVIPSSEEASITETTVKTETSKVVTPSNTVTSDKTDSSKTVNSGNEEVSNTKTETMVSTGKTAASKTEPPSNTITTSNTVKSIDAVTPSHTVTPSNVVTPSDEVTLSNTETPSDTVNTSNSVNSSEAVTAVNTANNCNIEASKIVTPSSTTETPSNTITPINTETPSTTATDNTTATSSSVEPSLSSFPMPGTVSADQAVPGSTVLVPMPVNIGGQTQMAYLPMKVGPDGKLSLPSQSPDTVPTFGSSQVLTTSSVPVSTPSSDSKTVPTLGSIPVSTPSSVPMSIPSSVSTTVSNTEAQGSS